MQSSSNDPLKTVKSRGSLPVYERSTLIIHLKALGSVRLTNLARHSCNLQDEYETYVSARLKLPSRVGDGPSVRVPDQAVSRDRKEPRQIVKPVQSFVVLLGRQFPVDVPPTTPLCRPRRSGVPHTTVQPVEGWSLWHWGETGVTKFESRRRKQGRRVLRDRVLQTHRTSKGSPDTIVQQNSLFGRDRGVTYFVVEGGDLRTKWK